MKNNIHNVQEKTTVKVIPHREETDLAELVKDNPDGRHVAVLVDDALDALVCGANEGLRETADQNVFEGKVGVVGDKGFVRFY